MTENNAGGKLTDAKVYARRAILLAPLVLMFAGFSLYKWPTDVARFRLCRGYGHTALACMVQPRWHSHELSGETFQGGPRGGR